MPSTKKEVSASEMERRRNVARVILDHAAANGISVNELAQKTKVANSALYNVTGCKTGMGIDLALRLATDGGMDTNTLLRAAGFVINNDKRDATVLRISEKAAQLPKDRLDVLEGIADGMLEAIRKNK